MSISRTLLSALSTGLLAHPAAALAQQKPKLDDVLRSISESSRGEQQSLDFTPFLLLIVACVLMYVAVKHWNRRQMSPKVVHNHTKLIKEASRAAGISPRKLRALESLANAQGFSSPLVAILCPSAISTLARNVKTDSERQAITELANEVLNP